MAVTLSFLGNQETKKKAGRPKKVDTENLVPKIPQISPKTKISTKVEKVLFSENLLSDWMLECAFLLEKGWELKTVPNKHWIEIVRFNDTEQMPFAFVDRKNGNIHCPAVMHGEPHEDIRGNISDPDTRLACMTPNGVICFFTWQPTHPNYKLHKNLDFSTLHANIEHKEKVESNE